MKPNKIFIAVAVSVCVAVAGIAYIISNNSDTDEKETDISYETLTETEDYETYIGTEDLSIYVYVCGCVNNPGIVCVKQGDRIYQAIELAGGMNGEADVNAVNQAEYAEDGQKIYIPAIGENYVSEDNSSDNGLININTADVSVLTTLSGIGESRAEAIISYRETNGPFGSIEDIMKVSGIKEAAFDRIKDYICV